MHITERNWVIFRVILKRRGIYCFFMVGNWVLIYIGFKENKRPELIEAESMPTKESHPQYDFFYGPFKTKEDASKYVKAMTGLACAEG